MSKGRVVYAHQDTVAGAEMIVSATGLKFGGFFLNGSAGSATLSILDGTVIMVKTSAGADANITVNLDAPIACTTSLLATCSGTGFYSVFFTT